MSNKFWNEKVETISTEELEKLQLLKLNKIINYTHRYSPFYQVKFGKNKIQKLKKLSDIQSLPLTSKSEIINANMDDLIATDKKRVVEVHLSSATTNKPSPSFWTDTDLKKSSTYLARTWYMQGVRQETTFGMLASYGMFSAGLLNHYAIQEIGAFVVPVSHSPAEKTLNYLDMFQVDSVASVASYYLYMINKLSSGSHVKTNLNLKNIIAGGEPFTENQRHYIEKSLNVKMYDQYGLCEINTGLAGECAYQNGLHILADYAYPEIINPETLQACEPGESGELVLTTLEREASPLIRYRTGDITSINYETCKCGRTMPRLSRFKERVHDTIFYKGSKIQTNDIKAFLEELGGYVDPYFWTLQIQGSMSDQNMLLKLINRNDMRLASFSTYIAAKLLKRFGIRIEVDILSAEEIDNMGSGKLKYIQDLRREIS